MKVLDKSFMAMEVNAVNVYIVQGVLAGQAKSAPAHEEIALCDQCIYKLSSLKKLKAHIKRTRSGNIF